MADDKKAIEEMATALSGIENQLSEINEVLQRIAHILEDQQQLPPQARIY
jgi:chaperonin cofactor prefoldin